MRYRGRVLGIALTAVLAAGAARVWAVEPVTPANQPARKAAVSAPGNQVDDGQALRFGVVTALGGQGDRVEIQGHWHRIDPGRTRFFQRGRAVPADALKKGQTVKFTLASEKSEGHTLGAVYVP